MERGYGSQEQFPAAEDRLSRFLAKRGVAVLGIAFLAYAILMAIGHTVAARLIGGSSLALETCACVLVAIETTGKSGQGLFWIIGRHLFMSGLFLSFAFLVGGIIIASAG